mmetsp:Transcript_1986/g.3728  ORF Transcript_1986/g.3728 Transcript_1986/m.3728 type:complete len:288 (-) Transcript_1986:642-1505(-)
MQKRVAKHCHTTKMTPGFQWMYCYKAKPFKLLRTPGFEETPPNASSSNGKRLWLSLQRHIDAIVIHILQQQLRNLLLCIRRTGPIHLIRQTHATLIPISSIIIFLVLHWWRLIIIRIWWGVCMRQCRRGVLIPFCTRWNTAGRGRQPRRRRVHPRHGHGGAIPRHHSLATQRLPRTSANAHSRRFHLEPHLFETFPPQSIPLILSALRRHRHVQNFRLLFGPLALRLGQNAFQLGLLFQCPFPTAIVLASPSFLERCMQACLLFGLDLFGLGFDILDLFAESGGAGA